MGIEPCSLDGWIAARTGIAQLTLAGLRAYQLDAIRRVLAYAVANAPFYRERFPRLPDLHDFSDFMRLPVLMADDLVAYGNRMLCVEQEQVRRICTSGTTEHPKRLCFTDAELAATVDYFVAGARQFLQSGDTALLLFDSSRENGAGQLFLRALTRMGVTAIPYGVPSDGKTACRAVCTYMPSLLLTAPDTARAMLAYGGSSQFTTLLVSGDALSNGEVALLRTRFGCDVFQQYGLTESAFGLGVDCRAFAGYHLREVDYYTEILDAQGNALPAGEAGRVVITSLCNGAMPLIRYDTGDRSMYLPGMCACASPLPLLDRVAPRAVPKGYHSAHAPAE